MRRFARSRDGGASWLVEDAFEAGIARRAADHCVDSSTELVECRGGFDFTDPDFALTFDRLNNSDGPSHFYCSSDRGHSWEGPFSFPNFDTAGIATRTDYIVDGPLRMIVFLTAAKSDHSEGRVLCAETVDGARSWTKLSWIGGEDDGYAIMPAAVRLSQQEILVTIRRKNSERAWLDAYCSDDNGRTWKQRREPASDLGGGNPPAMIRLMDGRICVAYGVRERARAGEASQASRMCVRISSDGGRTWGDETAVRGGDGATWDMGYPRMTQRPDGRIVLVYYYNRALRAGTPYRFIAATVFDPKNL